jgi:salicylate hydroxylase
MALQAVVVGAGIGGTAAALALVRAGIDVQIYEQAQQLAEVGAGGPGRAQRGDPSG